MDVRIEDSCTSCGLCVDTCPEVFDMGTDMAEVQVDQVPAELEESVQQAADECPVEAIAEGDIYKIDPDVCTDCGACADVCPVEAIIPE